jgi:hypothetical protein
VLLSILSVNDNFDNPLSCSVSLFLLTLEVPPTNQRIFLVIIFRIYIMSYLLPQLSEKAQIDHVILNTEDKVVVLRFGRSTDPVCMQVDETVRTISMRMLIM